MEDSPRGRIVRSRGLPRRGFGLPSDTGSGMTLGDVTAMIRIVTARPGESGSDYATGHESTVGSALELAVGLRQGQPYYPTEEDTNMESAPWEYRSFERIRMVNSTAKQPKEVLFLSGHRDHDLATLPAEVEELTGNGTISQTLISRRFQLFRKFARSSKPSLASLNSIRGVHK